MGVGVPELIIIWVVSIVVPLTVAYYLIKAAVRNGVLEALRRHEIRRARGDLGSERSPNSRT
jgi:hypothetical protein